MTAPTIPDPGVWRRRMAYALLLPIPVAVVALLFWIRAIKGPYWLALNYDPAYAYLLNSLAIAEARAPRLVEHPGTPLQVLGAIVIRTIHLVRDTPSVRQDVLENPEVYLRGIHGAITALYGLALLLVGGATLRRTRRMAAALLMQASPLLTCAMLPIEVRVMPESLLMVVGALFSLVVLLYVWQPPHEASRAASPDCLRTESPVPPVRGAWTYPILLGTLAGVGAATKLTFVPLAIVPLVLLESRRSRLVYFLTAPLAFLVSTLPALQLYPRLVGWHARWAGHTGLYGSGKAGLFDTENLQSLSSVLTQSELLPIAAVASVAALAWLWRLDVTGAMTDHLRRVRRGLVALILGAAVEALMLLKQPRYHYFVPVLCCLGLGTVLLLEVSKSLPRWMRHAGTALAVLAVGYVGIVQLLLLDRWRVVWPKTVELQLEAYRMAERRFPDAARIYFYRASARPYAFQAATRWAGDWFNEDLRRLYPDSYLWLPHSREFVTFGRKVRLEEITAGHPDVVFLGEGFGADRGPGMAVSAPPGVLLERAFKGRRESLYKLRGMQTDGEAPAVIEAAASPSREARLGGSGKR